MSPLLFVGIDVSQARLDMAVRPGASFSITHTESAIETSMPTKMSGLIAASCRALPCEMRAQRPSQLFGLYR